jgi:hypothetical protein
MTMRMIRIRVIRVIMSKKEARLLNKGMKHRKRKKRRETRRRIRIRRRHLLLIRLSLHRLMKERRRLESRLPTCQRRL